MDFGEIDIEAAEQLLQIEQQVEELENELRKEQEKLSRQYAVKKQPIYQKRDELAKNIPKFWALTLTNSPIMEDIMKPEEMNLINMITLFKVDRTDNDYKLIFEFEKNDWFSDTRIVKCVSIDADGVHTFTHPKINWSAGKKFAPKVVASASASKKRKVDENEFVEMGDDDTLNQYGFFAWLEDGLPEDDDVIDSYLANEVYPNAAAHYTGVDSEDFDSEEEEDDKE